MTLPYDFMCHVKPPLCKGRWAAERRLGGVDAGAGFVFALAFGEFVQLCRTIPQSACSADSSLYTREPLTYTASNRDESNTGG